MNAFIRNSEGAYQPASSAEIIRLAKNIISGRLRRTENIVVTSPTAVTQYLQLQLGAKEQEIFSAMFLDTRHRLISKSPAG